MHQGTKIIVDGRQATTLMIVLLKDMNNGKEYYEDIKNREDILDIKYQGEGNHPTYSIERVSALILMK